MEMIGWDERGRRILCERILDGAKNGRLGIIYKVQMEVIIGTTTHPSQKCHLLVLGIQSSFLTVPSLLLTIYGSKTDTLFGYTELSTQSLMSSKKKRLRIKNHQPSAW